MSNQEAWLGLVVQWGDFEAPEKNHIFNKWKIMITRAKYSRVG